MIIYIFYFIYESNHFLDDLVTDFTDLATGLDFYD